MPRRIIVKMGDLEISDSPGDVLTSVLGSCVGVILLDRNGPLTGMAHIMLPERTKGMLVGNRKAKYAGPGVLALVREMMRRGSRKDDLYAKLCGGARLFGENSLQNIGERNVAVTRAALRKLNIPILAERVGGEVGRNVIVEVGTGRVIVKVSGDHAEVI
ncbi:MAG: chemotaxis protein CheD [Actinomycetota bacterium]|jgi:chemotaxis protein CheD|nr:chemotaxis protein CheD [Actinomycetota bacterium]MDI7253316.1 chemotaxis protein CheD [Actinomycetota bacterium]